MFILQLPIKWGAILAINEYVHSAVNGEAICTILAAPDLVLGSRFEKDGDAEDLGRELGLDVDFDFHSDASSS